MTVGNDHNESAPRSWPLRFVSLHCPLFYLLFFFLKDFGTEERNKNINKNFKILTLCVGALVSYGFAVVMVDVGAYYS